MKHISYAGEDLIVGDAAADALLHFAAELGTAYKSGVVDLAVIAGDGDEVLASFLVGSGMDLVVRTVHSTGPEPDNTDRIAEITRGYRPGGTAGEVASSPVTGR